MQRQFKRRSIFTIEELLETFSSEAENDKAFKFAMFNGLAMLIFLILVLIAASVYCILQPFVKPLIWALLCGSALHPLKLLIAEKLKTEITKLESSSRPIYINLLWMPFSYLLKLSELVGDFFMDNWQFFSKVAGGICGFLTVYFLTPRFLVQLYYLFMNVVSSFIFFLLNIFNNSFMMGTTVIGYASALFFFWNKNREEYFFALLPVVWISVTAWFSNFFGYFRVISFMFIQLSVLVCYSYKVMYGNSILEDGSQPSDETRQDEDVHSTDSSNETRFTYVRWLILLCVGAIVINFPSFPFFLVSLLLMYVLKRVYVSSGAADIVNSRFDLLYQKCKTWFVLRQNVLYPPVLQYTHSACSEAHLQFLQIMKNSSDAAAAVAVIFALLFISLFFSVFLTFQAYRESIFIVQSGGEIINNTVINNPEIHQMLPDDWQERAEALLNNTYIYLREGIVKIVRSVLKSRGIEEEKGAEIERGALELWDRAYQAWVMPVTPATVGPTVTPDAFFTSFHEFIKRLQTTPEVMSVEWLSTLVQDNMAVLSSGLDSVWSILRGNMSLLISIVTTLFSLLFGGGVSLLNLLINSVVFLTSLFYLLSSSGSMYKPVEIITQLSPKYGNKLAVAVQKSCQEVITVSVKFAIFYGLWTWLIHTFLFCNLVYMPAVFAAVLGAVPVLGTYWACIPAVVELWVVQSSKLRAIALIIAQVFPSVFIDTRIYNEIKGGHPYLTGLSIAGGMFWLGIEGVVGGPLLLCLLFVMLNMFSSSTTGSSTADEEATSAPAT